MLVSVIIPCYNVEHYIHECINSVINQTYQPIEIICVDNNSTDNTWNVLVELQKQYPKLILAKELKPGAPAARNKGLLLAEGEWIQFLDADDLLEATKISHQINLIKENTAFIAAACKKRSVGGKEHVVPIAENYFIAPFLNQCGNTCSNLWAKKWVKLVGNWNEELSSSQETDLMFRIVLNDGICDVDSEPLTIIRERENGQISQGNPEKKWKQYINIRLSYLRKIKKNNPEIYHRYKGIYFDFLMISIITFSKYNKKDALSIYNYSIKPEWKSSNTYGFSKFRVFLIKTFGFNLFSILLELNAAFHVKK